MIGDLGLEDEERSRSLTYLYTEYLFRISLSDYKFVYLTTNLKQTIVRKDHGDAISDLLFFVDQRSQRKLPCYHLVTTSKKLLEIRSLSCS